MDVSHLSFFKFGVYDVVRTATACDEDVLFDGSWEDTEEGVVDVFADEVHTSWCTGDVSRFMAESLGELSGE